MSVLIVWWIASRFVGSGIVKGAGLLQEAEKALVLSGVAPFKFRVRIAGFAGRKATIELQVGELRDWV